jgi:phosphoribosylformylglycinamidine cyclo-ligase
MAEQLPGLRYSDAGVDIDAANEALAGMKKSVRSTFNDNVLQDIGSFGAMYHIGALNIDDPVLVSSVDGVGTKLKLAFMTGKHGTVGIDIVSHCVNDILVQGASPLFFLDYLAVGKLEPQVVTEVVQGIATGCRYAGCALIGGETAEMPDMYAKGEYDLAGTIVGVVDRKKIVDGSRINEGDAIIALPSSGLHTNGYSLARKIVFEVAGLGVNDPMPGYTGKTVAEVMMEPHLSYAKLMQIVMKVVEVKGMAHITGGGITDNFPRCLPDGVGAEIDLSSWTPGPLFKFLAETGNVAESEMLRTFNMGAGFLFVVPESQGAKAIETVGLAGQPAWRIGRVIKGEGVHYNGAVSYGA